MIVEFEFGAVHFSNILQLHFLTSKSKKGADLSPRLYSIEFGKAGILLLRKVFYTPRGTQQEKVGLSNPLQLVLHFDIA